MSTKAISSRYAMALLQEAERLKCTSTVESDLATVRRILESAPDLRIVFRSPVVKAWQKMNIAKDVFAGQVSELTLAFIVLVIEKGREAYLGHIAQVFQELLDAKNNVLRVTVNSAAALDGSSQKKLQTALEQRTGKHVVPTFASKPDLIGGVVVRIGDIVLDGSLRHRLQELKHELAHT